MNQSLTTPSSPRTSLLLGIFVLFQLIFLPLANFIQLVPREMPPERGELDIRLQREGTVTDVRLIQGAINSTGTAIDRWGEVSGQPQVWSLFAPGFPTQSIYPIVEGVFPAGFFDDRRAIQPRIPPDPDHYFRWPSWICRLNSYDYLMAAVMQNYTEASFQEHPEEWRTEIAERVRRQQRSLEAYFRFSLTMLQEFYPGYPTPSSMILRVKIVPSPMPGTRERGQPLVVFVARWVPDRPATDGFLPIEAYDPVQQRFVPLAKERE